MQSQLVFNSRHFAWIETTIDILANLDGEQNKIFGENLCVYCMAAVLIRNVFYSETWISKIILEMS
jgi:hypothetical protein